MTYVFAMIKLLPFRPSANLDVKIAIDNLSQCVTKNPKYLPCLLWTVPGEYADAV